MLVIEKRCNICKVVKVNKVLLNRLYQSSFFVPHSQDNILKISEETGLQYRALLNHVKKHQFIDSQDYTEAMLKQADKNAENKAVQKAVKAQNALQSVIDIGHQRLEEGEITVTTDQLIKASQVKVQAEAKQKDQDLMAISLAHFISGESTNERVYVDADISAPHEPTESDKSDTS